MSLTFGEKIKLLRKEKNITQKKLGERLNVSQSAVAQFEKLTETPKLSTVRKIAEALDVTISELVEDWSSFSQEEIVNDFVITPPGQSSGVPLIIDLMDYTDEERKELLRYAEYLRMKRDME